MKHTAFILFVYLALVLQASLSQTMSVNGSQPHFLMLALALAVLMLEGWTAIVWAAVIGLLADCLTAQPLGIEMIIATFAAFLVQQLRGHRQFESFLLLVLASFAIVWTVMAASLSVRVVWLTHEVNIRQFLETVTGNATYTTVLIAAVLLVWRLVKNALPQGTQAGFSNRWKMLTD